MKTVYLLRHAHAEAALPAMDDHDRPLSARGIAESEGVGRFLKNAGHAPALALCSTALRTVQTLAIVLQGVPQKTTRSLYLAARDDILDEIRETDNTHDSVMVVGHNPGMGELAFALSREDTRLLSFPPAALAVFTCDVENWEDVAAARAHLIDFFMP